MIMTVTPDIDITAAILTQICSIAHRYEAEEVRR
jgi:hypothetical protein